MIIVFCVVSYHIISCQCEMFAEKNNKQFFFPKSGALPEEQKTQTCLKMVIFNHHGCRWRPLYNPVFPSQMKRSGPVGYLHYRDNPLVEAILRQPPFCLKVEITEISKPFISNDWAGSLKPHRGKVSIARPQVAAATTKMKEILIL